MAVTSVASPQHCFKYQAAPTLNPPRRKNRRRVSGPKPAGRGQPDHQSRGPGRSPAPDVKNLIMDKVRILKRGEKLHETATELPINAAAAVPPPQRVSSNRSEKAAAESNSNGVVESSFAGASFFMVSPPPSSVPVPMFCLKKKKVAWSWRPPVDLSATV